MREGGGRVGRMRGSEERKTEFVHTYNTCT